MIISGLGTNIYQYNIDNNTYKTLISTLNIGSFNILIKESTTIYLLHTGVFLTSEETLDK